LTRYRTSLPRKCFHITGRGTRFFSSRVHPSRLWCQPAYTPSVLSVPDTERQNREGHCV